MKKSKKTILGSILAFAILVSVGAFAAQSDVFSSNEIQSETLSYLEKTDNQHAELKCGEGKCGDGDSKESDSSDESKCSDGKCGDGKDAEKSDEKSEDGKCGEGKCGN